MKNEVICSADALSIAGPTFCAAKNLRLDDIREDSTDLATAGPADLWHRLRSSTQCSRNSEKLKLPGSGEDIDLC